MSACTRRSLAILVLLAAAPFSAASELGKRLNHELRGGWGVLGVEVYSACGGTYSDNKIGAAGVASKAPRRFAAGELVKVDKVKVKRRRVDLLLTLDAPIRVSRMDGPFELFDRRSCQVQLMVSVPREMVKGANLEGLLSEVTRHITLFPSRAEARISDLWNGRETEPLPADYEDTLQRHAVWKAEQTNAAVHAGIDRAISRAAAVTDDIDDDADYLEGFAEGAELMAGFSVTRCDSLIRASFAGYDKIPPADRSRGFKEGWDDGQKLVFFVLLADRLRSCLVPVPPPPTP